MGYIGIVWETSIADTRSSEYGSCRDSNLLSWFHHLFLGDSTVESHRKSGHLNSSVVLFCWVEVDVGVPGYVLRSRARVGV